jgi:diguanylate cyclase (GGDEF)-like protein
MPREGVPADGAAPRAALGSAHDNKFEATAPASHRASRLTSRSAQALLFGAGLVTIVNSLVSELDGVNVGALRFTGAATLVASFFMPLLPWAKGERLVSFGVGLAAMIALVGTDFWHHYSRNDSAIAVYPIFFILVIAWSGMTQPRGAAALVACFSGIALGWMLASAGHVATALQCIAVMVPAAAIMGETVSWAYGRAVQLAQLDADRRAALEALVSGSSRLQDAVTPEESEEIVVATATAMFKSRDTRLERSEQGIDDGPGDDDTTYDPVTRELRIRVRGQSGVVGTVVTVVEQPDTFLFDAARLYSQHIGTRLEQLRMIDALTDAATHDALTGVGNRRAAQISIAALQPGDVVFILDLDHFKTINDSLGHQAGDRVLTEFGDYLRSSSRPTDSIARYGGEEFLLVSRGASREAADLIANRLLDGWRARRPLVTFSIGYAMHEPRDRAELTIEHADMALYEAKRQGRDRAQEFAPITHDHHLQAEADVALP